MPKLVMNLGSLWLRRRLRVAVKVGLAMATSPLLVFHDDLANRWLVMLMLGVPVGLIGALVGGAIAGWIGRPGLVGALKCICAGVLVVLLTAALAGLAVLPPVGFVYVPIMLMQVMVIDPIIPACLLAMALAIHFTERRWLVGNQA